MLARQIVVNALTFGRRAPVKNIHTAGTRDTTVIRGRWRERHMDRHTGTERRPPATHSPTETQVRTSWGGWVGGWVGVCVWGGGGVHNTIEESMPHGALTSATVLTVYLPVRTGCVPIVVARPHHQLPHRSRHKRPSENTPKSGCFRAMS